MTWVNYAIMIVAALVIQSFFSMMEMSSVSFNKVRLQYYKFKGYARARWLIKLMSRPGRFFGTTLIMVNSALQFGSESARQLFISLNLDPDYSAIMQVLLVLIFAELAPLFAARKHAEQVAMFGAPVLILFSKILTPVIYILDLFVRGFNRLFGVKVASGAYLTRDELQKAIESREDPFAKQGDFEAASAQIFKLKAKSAKELMQPLDEVNLVSDEITVEAIQSELSGCVPIYHKNMRNITGLIYPRNLLRADAKAPLAHYSRSPWFIAESTSILDIVRQFRTNNQTLAIVLDLSGLAIGVLALDTIINEIFGSLESAFPQDKSSNIVIERTFSGDTLISKINAALHIQLPDDGEDTLNDLLISLLGHPPAKGESLRLERLELKVLETSLLGARTVLIKTI
ncbi:MAG: HlyC/CorC family transporter [Chlamydiia bacterium]|nr:HlyC/CorC family transporter [Chlamydiia bacterium]